MEAKRLKWIEEKNSEWKQEFPKIVEIIKCPKCNNTNDKKKARMENYVCCQCGAYMRIDAHSRIKMMTDSKSFEPWFDEMPMSNPLENAGYEEKIKETRNKTGLDEAVIVGKATIFGEPAIIGVCDSKFLMGSMGYSVGEKITRAVERATEWKLPIFLFCCSGGARMQEGIISLMQMAKTSAALKRHSESGLLYTSILTDPTMGGVTASFAMLGDIILAEPGALIGFAGPRVIKQTLGCDLPQDAQTAEYLVSHGIIDGIVKREDLKRTLYYLIITNKKYSTYTNFREQENKKFVPTEIAREKEFYSKELSAWQKVKEVRKFERPSALDYVNHIFDYFFEVHGDRNYSDDKAVIGGLALLDGQPITVIAGQKGKNPEEAIRSSRGMPMPEGYRKALRLMKEAEKFNRPIISFIDTPGAFCGLAAEARGQGEAIAKNLFEMSNLKVPILCIIIGEAGSGGALATAVGNEVWMLENSLYSILSPEGYAAILWKDSSKAEEAAEIMKITARDLKKLNVIEQIIPEYGGADEHVVSSISGYLKINIMEFLKNYSKFSPEQIASHRYTRFRSF